MQMQCHIEENRIEKKRKEERRTQNFFLFFFLDFKEKRITFVIVKTALKR
jgi:hypothetical protein